MGVPGSNVRLQYEPPPEGGDLRMTGWILASDQVPLHLATHHPTLYLPEYPESRVEVRIGDKYKPDVVQLNAAGEPDFWGEAGMVGRRKIESLVRRYKNTHFVISKWDTRLDPFEKMVAHALDGATRSAPFDLIRFPVDSIARFIDDEGNITITQADVEWIRLE